MKKEVYIIGGGPSLKGFDFSLLADRDTIAVNSAIQDVPNPTHFITCCSAFCKRVVEKDFFGVKTNKVLVMGKKHLRYASVTKFFYAFDEVIDPITGDGTLGFSLGTFAVGGNSGFSALQYAVLLGYKIIYLLGIDVQIRDGIHYHKRYNILEKDVDWWRICFEKGISIIKENSDIHVYSCSPISDLNRVIPFIDFKDIDNELD